MEYPQDIYISWFLYKVRNSVMAVEKNTHFAARYRLVYMPNLGVISQHLGFFEYSGYDFFSSLLNYLLKCIRRCPWAIAKTPQSTLFLPCPDPALHFLVGNSSAFIRVHQASVDHQIECQLPQNLVIRAVVWLILNKFCQFIFSCCHSFILLRIDSSPYRQSYHRMLRNSPPFGTTWWDQAKIFLCVIIAIRLDMQISLVLARLPEIVGILKAKPMICRWLFKYQL